MGFDRVATRIHYQGPGNVWVKAHPLVIAGRGFHYSFGQWGFLSDDKREPEGDLALLAAELLELPGMKLLAIDNGCVIIHHESPFTDTEIGEAAEAILTPWLTKRLAQDQMLAAASKETPNA